MLKQQDAARRILRRRNFLMEKQTTNENSAAQESAAYERARDYFLGRSVEPAKTVPDLLAENREIAYKLAEHVLEGVAGIAEYFGIDMLDLVMHSLPENLASIEVDGIRELAAARTYIDLRGSVPLSEICEGTHAYPAPTLRCIAREIQRRERKSQVIAKDPLLSRLFFSGETIQHKKEAAGMETAETAETAGAEMAETAETAGAADADDALNDDKETQDKPG